ncbi:hypothetical protein HHK36_027754 [Tetracentron sinense]|uniref:Uncharacterized protein n=1 Tax=Tetracentron sinense TaxID=13715 RepID=A0A834YH86_TETSI|nr:hypothetical protein HHK36_027754 [Tetracentron sinense]
MAQWESARLEAEARLSRESSLFNPPSLQRPNSDYYLRIWNSEVGESFRRFNSPDTMASQSPMSPGSSSTKCGSGSLVMTEVAPAMAGASTITCDHFEEMECKSCKSEAEEYVMMAGSDSLSSNELDESSDTALQLLLDFPSGDDMGFLQQIDNFSMFPNILSERSLNSSAYRV